MKKEPTKQEMGFALTLRRILYLAVLFDYNVQELRDIPITPSHMKVELNNIFNSLNRFIKSCKFRTTVEVWEQINQDVSKDQLHDIAILIDEVSDVTDITGIIDAIRKVKAECLAEQTKAA